MTPLDETLEAMTVNNNKLEEFYNLFLNSDIYIPVHDRIKGESYKRANEHETIMPVITKSDGVAYFLMFDSKDKLSTWAQHEVAYVVLPGHAVVEMMSSDFHYILNIGTEYAKSFVPDEIDYLKECVTKLKGQEASLSKGTRVLIGAPAAVPDGLIDSLKRSLSRNREVLTAYLGQVHYLKEGEKPHLVLVVHVDSSSNTVVDVICKDISLAASGFLKKDEYFDICLDDGGTISSGVTDAVEPFYIRGDMDH